MDYATNIQEEHLQYDAQIVCDLLDTVLQQPATRSLQFMHSHVGPDDEPHLEIERHYVYEHEQVSTALTITYDRNERHNAEVYDVIVAKSGLFSDNKPSQSNVVSYRLFRVNDAVKEAHVTARYHLSSYDVDLLSIAPATRALMRDDMTELYDICTNVLAEAS